MATAITTLNGALSDSANRLTLAAYTAPSGRAKPLLRIDDEIFLITDTASSPTLGVVRGYMGTSAVAHQTLAGAEYGNPTDFPVTSKGPSLQTPSFFNPAIFSNVQVITASGATGAVATPVTTPAPAFLNVTGATGVGINFGVPSVGESYFIKNKTTGTFQIYSIGATINGTTGSTAVDVTVTGNKGLLIFCATAGAWETVLGT